MKLSKKFLAKNKGVDVCLLEESMRISRRLAKTGIRGKRIFSLPSPFDHRMKTTTVLEHLASKKG
jgi:hypothetical protein